MSTASGELDQNSILGVKGVRLKRFERVLAAVLPQVKPAYTQLPPLSGTAAERTSDWPFDKLPATARVLGSLEGQLSDLKRATRKENQLRSMLRCVFSLLPSSTSSDASNEAKEPEFTIVDFGGGTGHLGIPLALLLPSCRVIVVDLHERSLQLLHRKASKVAQETPPDSTTKEQSVTPKILIKESLQACEGIPNLFTFFGPVEAFHETFDMAVALHLCGEATDVCLRKCGHVKARALVCASCCVGKLNPEKKNPYRYLANGEHLPTVQYPQSKLFCQFLNDATDWNALAKAADYSDMQECRTTRNAARRTAKALLETDRRLFLEETYGYQTALTRMEPWEATPKNDVLMAWREDCVPNVQGITDEECQADIQLTIDHLLVASSGEASTGNSEIAHSVDWTGEEEQDVRATLQTFVTSEDKRLVFPTRMSGRKRKLVHFVAEQMGLSHWGEGRKYRDKTVGVSRQRTKEADPKPES